MHITSFFLAVTKTSEGMVTISTPLLKPKLTRVLATNGGLVADGGNVGSAVTRALCLVKVDGKPVDLRADPVIVVELNTAIHNRRRKRNIYDKLETTYRKEDYTNSVSEENTSGIGTFDGSKSSVSQPLLMQQTSRRVESEP